MVKGSGYRFKETKKIRRRKEASKQRLEVSERNAIFWNTLVIKHTCNRSQWAIISTAANSFYVVKRFSEHFLVVSECNIFFLYKHIFIVSKILKWVLFPTRSDLVSNSLSSSSWCCSCSSLCSHRLCWSFSCCSSSSSAADFSLWRCSISAPLSSSSFSRRSSSSIKQNEVAKLS